MPLIIQSRNTFWTLWHINIKKFRALLFMSYENTDVYAKKIKNCPMTKLNLQNTASKIISQNACTS